MLDADWCDVMAADLALDELERIDGFQRQTEALGLASLLASATWEPHGLERAERALKQDMQRRRQDLTVDEVEAITKAADKVLRINRRARRRQIH